MPVTSCRIVLVRMYAGHIMSYCTWRYTDWYYTLNDLWGHGRSNYHFL